MLRHDTETLSALLALCGWNHPPSVDSGGLPLQRVIMQSCDNSSADSINNLWNKLSSWRWSEATWRSYDVTIMSHQKANNRVYHRVTITGHMSKPVNWVDDSVNYVHTYGRSYYPKTQDIKKDSITSHRSNHAKCIWSALCRVLLWLHYANHDDVIKWNHFPRYWPSVLGIHRSPMDSPNKGQRRGA